MLHRLARMLVLHSKRLQNDRIPQNFGHAVVDRHILQGVETGTKIVRCHKDMIGTVAPVPEGVLSGNEFNRRGDEPAGVSDGGEAINGAEVAGNVNR